VLSSKGEENLVWDAWLCVCVRVPWSHWLVPHTFSSKQPLCRVVSSYVTREDKHICSSALWGQAQATRNLRMKYAKQYKLNPLIIVLLLKLVFPTPFSNRQKYQGLRDYVSLGVHLPASFSFSLSLPLCLSPARVLMTAHSVSNGDCTHTQTHSLWARPFSVRGPRNAVETVSLSILNLSCRGEIRDPETASCPAGAPSVRESSCLHLTSGETCCLYCRGMLNWAQTFSWLPWNGFVPSNMFSLLFTYI